MATKKEIAQLAQEWLFATPKTAAGLDAALYCETRDVFQSRSDKMTNLLLKQQIIPENQTYLVAALIGEIGNNSFDHNLGKWRDVPGIFFGYDFSTPDNIKIVLADRGQGILSSLKKVKPSLQNDQEALETAFKEKLSGRAPENRGNGLKFVRKSVESQHMQLTFLSGLAKAELSEQMIITTQKKAIQGCLAILTFSGKVSV